MDTKTTWYLVTGLVIGFIIGALAVDKGVILKESVSLDEKGSMATSTEDGVTSEPRTSGIVLAGKNAIDIADQPAGMVVTVALTVLNEQGWVAIHEDEGGEPGRILGATLVFAGERNNVAVELLRATEKGKTYYAMLHTDDGDKAFDNKKDLAIKDSTGSVIMMKFVAE